ncbi:MAG: hypothetical protein EPN60_16970 [Nevskiaceae bacterium]|nr:MAG: hypothetical protein EPN60_16970 [Nevskiaceae bacterium]
MSRTTTDSVEDYGAKRALLQELRQRLIADAPEDVRRSCELLLAIEEDLTRLQFMLPERQTLYRRVADLRQQLAGGKVAA